MTARAPRGSLSQDHPQGRGGVYRGRGLELGKRGIPGGRRKGVWRDSQSCRETGLHLKHYMETEKAPGRKVPSCGLGLRSELRVPVSCSPQAGEKGGLEPRGLEGGVSGQAGGDQDGPTWRSRCGRNREPLLWAEVQGPVGPWEAGENPSCSCREQRVWSPGGGWGQAASGMLLEPRPPLGLGLGGSGGSPAHPLLSRRQ